MLKEDEITIMRLQGEAGMVTQNSTILEFEDESARKERAGTGTSVVVQ